jgi:hypothetical protein
MTRSPRRPSAAPRSRPGFPRLAAAWAILAASPIAFADATVPTTNDAKPVEGMKVNPPYSVHVRPGGHVATVQHVDVGTKKVIKLDPIHVCDGKVCKVEPNKRKP